MTTREIADQLVELCKQNRNNEVVDKFYADDVVTVEACEMGDGPRQMLGIDAVRQKHEHWYANFEPQREEIRGPFMHGDDQFAVVFDFTVKNKQTGDVVDMEEVAVYTVKDGKIVHESFFYTM